MIKPIRQIAGQQIVYDDKGHSCAICYNFTNENVVVTENHLMEKHSDILKSIAEAQS